MDRFDVAIAGGRCAGAALAIQLARQVLKVCVIDKTQLSADKASAYLFTPSGTAVLDRDERSRRGSMHRRPSKSRRVINR